MKSALLVIDVQEIYTMKGSEMYCKDSTRTVARINSLVHAFEEARLPIYFVRHIHKRDGSDLGRMFDFSGEAEEDFNFKQGDQEVNYDSRLHRPVRLHELRKNRYSALIGTGLLDALRKESVDRVVICGFMTNFCCESTARQAHDLDFHVDFVLDATGTPGTEHFAESEVRKFVGDSLSAGIGRVLSTRQFLKLWDQR